MPITIDDIVGAVGDSRARGIVPLLETPISRHIDQLMIDYQLDMNATGVAVVSMAMALGNLDNTVIKVGSPNHWIFRYRPIPAAVEPGAAPREPGAAPEMLEFDIVDDDIEEAERVPADTKNWLRVLVASVDCGANWLLDLSTCYQMSNIKARNIASYFMSLNSTVVTGSFVLPLIAYFAGRAPKLVDSARIRERLTASRFMVYHTSFAATPGLIMQMVEGLGAYARRLVDTQVLRIVRAAERNYWSEAHNQRIPVKLIAMACVWRDVNGREIPDWKQGAKSLDVVSAQTQAAWKALFRKINSFAAQDLSEVTSEHMLLRSIGENLKVTANGDGGPPGGGGGDAASVAGSDIAEEPVVLPRGGPRDGAPPRGGRGGGAGALEPPGLEGEDDDWDADADQDIESESEGSDNGGGDDNRD